MGHKLTVRYERANNMQYEHDCATPHEALQMLTALFKELTYDGSEPENLHWIQIEVEPE